MSLTDLIALMAPSFAGCVIFVAIHQCFGVHVLRRGVIFVDLALAQMSALGATLAFAAGHDPTSIGGLAYALCFSAMGAALLAFARALPKGIDHEAYIGIIYVVSTAATIVAVDQSPQGAEHVKQILVGSILGMTFEGLPKLLVLYGAVGTLLWFARRPIGEASGFTPSMPARAHVAWDFLFYFLFGLVVTSSVAIAGVLLVFCFLIVPSLIGSLFSRRPLVLHVVGGFAGTVASAAGLGASYVWDLPTGAALVIAFAAMLLVACLFRGVLRVSPPRRRASLHKLAHTVCAGILGIASLAMLWLIALPRADQPLLVFGEHVIGTGPERFLTPAERQRYAEAIATARLKHAQAAQLTQQERQSRWQGDSLSDEAIRRIGTFQQTFSEMARGEDFVVRELTVRARERQRWRVAPIGLAMCMAGLWLLLRPRWLAQIYHRGAEASVLTVPLP
ncbi:metal ABC transporter permease [Variovorax guangxiensis]|uniref:metal ABC transporter permease n=1 Tax=Variovorax guangxiensis TaxID=1775474 RepID=UPI0028622575|nr:metal ABC transporter permease [Variovorax guangxiensis]MDR6860991.1 zinc/manganese transport system permease protein [Variovorax guangxiensis]